MINVDELAKLFTDNLDIQVSCIAEVSSEGDPRAYQVSPLHEELADQFLDSAEATVTLLNQRSLVKWNPGWTTMPYEVPVGDLADLPELEATVDAARQFDSLKHYNPKADDQPRPRMLLLRVISRTDGAEVWFLQELTRGHRLQAKNKIIAMVSGDEFSPLAEEIFIFSKTHHAVIYNGSIALIKQFQVSRALQVPATVKREMREALQQAVVKLPISNLDEFLDAASSNPLMHGRVRSIANKFSDDVYRERMSVDVLIEVSEEKNIRLDYESVDGKPQLQWSSSPKERFRLLAWLDDDYVESVVTHRLYEANSKGRLDDGA